MGTSLEWMVFVEHLKVGKEEEDRCNHGRAYDEFYEKQKHGKRIGRR